VHLCPHPNLTVGMKLSECKSLLYSHSIPTAVRERYSDLRVVASATNGRESYSFIDPLAQFNYPVRSTECL
jgi:hypothetical protein